MSSSEFSPWQSPQFQHWVEDLLHLPVGPIATEMNIEGFKLSITTETRSQQQWIEARMAPMDLRDQISTVRKTKLNIISDCFASKKLHDYLAAEKIDHIRMPVLSKRMWWIPVRPYLDLCCSPSHGIIWLFDRENAIVTLITSPRTRFPLSEAQSTVRTLVVSHLHDLGWHTFHAGAVFSENAVRLIIGNSGQGKTSLVLALVSAGARFVANERILLKAEDDIIRAKPFPMSVLVGLGTAMQYPEMEDFLVHSERLLTTPQRFNRANLVSSPRNRWPELSDKIRLLPVELDQVFPNSKCHPGGKLDGIILPRLSPETPQKTLRASKRDVLKAVKHNYLPHTREKHYQDWMPLGLKSRTKEDANKIIDQLKEQSGVEVTFFCPDNADELLRNTLRCLAD